MSGRDPTSESARLGLLAEYGAHGEVAAELLTYNRNVVTERGWPTPPDLPLADERHIEAWSEYVAAARRDGPWPVLQRTFPQLRFPIRAGISQEDAYRAATLRGHAPPEDGRGLELRAPEALELYLHPSLAGSVPIIVAGHRHDFVSLVQAFCYRNEPRDVPDSMGACHVAGYNNWDRIRAHRRRWESGHPDASDDAAWSEEFTRLRANKASYQDRFVILSRGPYSAVAAGDIGIPDDAWLAHSLVIRRDHECAHAFTLRTFGALQNNLLEELVADYAGVLGALGRYRADLALRFLGLESFPRYREGGRLENYRGRPPISDGAFAVLVRLAHAAVANLERLDEGHRPTAKPGPALARMVFALTGMTLEEIAAPDAAGRVERVLNRLSRGGT